MGEGGRGEMERGGDKWERGGDEWEREGRERGGDELVLVLASYFTWGPL